MKISKQTLIILILNIIILPLLGNEFLLIKFNLKTVATIINYLLPSILCLFILIDMFKERYIPKLNVKTIILLSFWLVIAISLIFSITHKVYNFSNFFKFGCMTFIIFIIANIKLDDKQVKWINMTIVALFVLISLISILEYTFAFDLNQAGVEKYIGAKGRVRATFYITTLLDKYLVTNIIICYYLLDKQKVKKQILIPAIILGTLSLAFTFSRTGAIIYIFSAVIITLYFLFRKKLLYAGLSLALLIGIYFIPGQNFLFSSVSKYFVNISYSVSSKLNMPFISKMSGAILSPFIIDVNSINNDGLPYEDDYKEDDEFDIQLITNIDHSLNSRDYYEQVAKSIIKARPYFGIGIGSYTYIYVNQLAHLYNSNSIDISHKYMYPHNMFYQLGAETGIAGIILFFGLIIITLLKTTIFDKNIFSGLILICILLMCNTESIFYMKDIAYFMIIAIALFGNSYYINSQNKNPI